MFKQLRLKWFIGNCQFRLIRTASVVLIEEAQEVSDSGTKYDARITEIMGFDEVLVKRNQYTRPYDTTSSHSLVWTFAP